MDDGQKKDNTASPTAQPAVQPAVASGGYTDPHLASLHAHRTEKKGARAVFHLVNFGGLHQAFNNIASVVITYVMATTHLADTMKDKMASTAIGKGLSGVLSLPGKAVNGVFQLVGVDLNKSLNALPAAEKAAELEFRAMKSRRSAIETAFMCIAGFIALMPVYYLENHRAGFLNKVDNWLHPGRTPAEKKAAALKPGDEPKETVWNLFRARIIALAVVFGVDQTRDNIDSILKHKGKPNVDTVFGWGLGDKLYNKLPEKTRGWLARFFSGSLKGDNIALSGIQHEVRADVLKITDAPPAVRAASERMAEIGKEMKLYVKDTAKTASLKSEIKAIDQSLKAAGHMGAVERAVFAEQSRLFLTKEVFLTTILSVVIYASTKWPPAAHFIEKIGLAKKGSYDKEHGIGKYARKKEAETPEIKTVKTEERVTKTEGTLSKAADPEPKAETLAPVVPIESRRAELAADTSTPPATGKLAPVIAIESRRKEFKAAESHAAAVQEQKTTLAPAGIGA